MSDYIPPKVVLRILARLPVKSLLRFRCVCKDWYSFISNPDFIYQHLSHSLASTNKPTFLKYHIPCYDFRCCSTTERFSVILDNKFIRKGCTRLLKVPRNMFFKESSPKFVGYCNGLIALYESDSCSAGMLVLWNPSINQAFVSPTIEVEGIRYDGLGFGFGFVPQTKDYKFVSVAYVLKDKGQNYYIPRVKIFALSSGEWSTREYEAFSESKTCIDSYYKRESEVFVDGALHWSGKKVERSGGTKSISRVIVKFDLSVEKFGEIVLPMIIANAKSINYVEPVMLKGLFCVAYYDEVRNSNAYNRRCAIWAMKDYGDAESWAQLYEFELKERIGRVFGMSRDGEILLSVKSGELVSYNSENGKCTHTGMFGKNKLFFMDDYVESLVLLGKGDDVPKRWPDPDCYSWLATKVEFLMLISVGIIMFLVIVSLTIAVLLI